MALPMLEKSSIFSIPYICNSVQVIRKMNFILKSSALLFEFIYTSKCTRSALSIPNNWTNIVHTDQFIYITEASSTHSLGAVN